MKIKNLLKGLKIKNVSNNSLFDLEVNDITWKIDDIKDDSIPPQIVLSNVSLFNKPNEKKATQ